MQQLDRGRNLDADGVVQGDGTTLFSQPMLQKEELASTVGTRGEHALSTLDHLCLGLISLCLQIEVLFFLQKKKRKKKRTKKKKPKKRKERSKKKAKKNSRHTSTVRLP